MAGDDQDSKTEAPTGKRLAEAREKGNVPMSRDMVTWIGLSATSAVLLLVLPTTLQPLLRTLRHLVEQPDRIAVGRRETLQALLVGLLQDVGAAVAIPFALLCAIAIAGHVMQTGLIFTTEKMKPSFGRLSPLGGLKRMFSGRGLIEFGKNLLKLTLVGVIALVILRPALDGLTDLPTLAVHDLVGVIVALLTSLLKGVLIALAGIAILDFAYQRFQHIKSLRMSKQEIKDEHKQAEGDPMLKARMRSIRVNRSRKRMMKSVPDASVVITNPTHYAVALKYDMAAMAAPRVVAKGADLIAAKIRAVAEEHGVPIIENPPVARALFAAVDVDQEIPPEHYKAVAEIIGFVMKLKRPPRRAAQGEMLIKR